MKTIIETASSRIDERNGNTIITTHSTTFTSSSVRTGLAADARAGHHAGRR